MPRVAVGNFSIEYEEQGSGEPLLLLHTLLADRSVYERVIPELAETWRVISPNFPGYGESQGEIQGGIEVYADLVAAFIDVLGLAKVDLLGNGFGGFVAQSIALRHPNRIKRLMLVDTAPAFPDEAKAPLRALRAKALSEGMSSVLDAAMLRMFPPAYIEAAPDVIATRRAALSAVDPKLFANACEALVMLDHMPHLGKISHKTLVLVGLEDQTTPPALSHQLADGIKGAKLVELPGVGHCPQLQAPDAFLAAIKSFLA